MSGSRFLIRSFDYLIVLYFIIHVPITVLCDVQSILDRRLFPAWAVKAVDTHVRDHGDHLVGTNPVWFKSFIWGELVLQLPVFLPLAWGVLRESSWVRIPCIIYGTNAATTVIPMLAEFLFSETVKTPNYVGAAIYSPYLVLPLLLVLRMWLFWSKPAFKTKMKAA